MPEKKWIFSVHDLMIKSTNYEGETNSIKISDIEKVIIYTDDSGSWGTDLWWNLKNHEIEIFIPNGATGENEMVEELQKLNGFKNEVMMKAMSCTENKQFECFTSTL